MLMEDLADMNEKLKEIGELKEGWYEPNRGTEFDPEFLSFIKETLEGLEYAPDIFPIVDGSIQVEFENNNGDYLEITIYPDDWEDSKVYVLFYSGNSATHYIEKDEYHAETINREVSEFMEW